MLRYTVGVSALLRGFLISLIAGLALVGCAETELAVQTAKGIGSDGTSAGAEHYKVGKPYQVAGTWYYPSEDYEYAETGIASWYGPGFHGKRTANGATYDQNALTAAHRTLPMPSIVRVTNLENGRSLKLRVNDRGPFAKNRIIDVSKRAAELLGFRQKGTAKVRVEILPAESRRAVTAALNGESDAVAAPAVPIETVMVQDLNRANPDGSLARSAGTVIPRVLQSAEIRPAAAGPDLKEEVIQYAVAPSDIFIQVGSFARKHNALRLQAQLSGLAKTRIQEVRHGDATFFRVQLGPVSSVGEADQMIAVLGQSGIDGATITVE